MKDETNAVVVVLAHTGTTSKNGFDEGVVAVSELISQHASIIAIQVRLDITFINNDIEQTMIFINRIL